VYSDSRSLDRPRGVIFCPSRISIQPSGSRAIYIEMKDAVIHGINDHHSLSVCFFAEGIVVNAQQQASSRLSFGGYGLNNSKCVKCGTRVPGIAYAASQT
jgi:hypothetical protein